MLITSKDIANKARGNKQFMRFLKETKLFREYFRNINLHGFSSFNVSPPILDKQLIAYAFNWNETKRPATWEHISSIWLHIALLKIPDIRDLKLALKSAKESIENYED